MSIEEKLNDFKGTQIISIDTLTEVKLKGGIANPMQGRIQKLSKGNTVMIFKSAIGYQNMVNRRLQKENPNAPEFISGPRPWGQRIPNTPFVLHNNNLYLECIFLRSGKSIYFLDGTEIKKEDIIGLTEKSEGEQGGLEDKVIIRCFKMDSIVEVRKSKETILGPILSGR